MSTTPGRSVERYFESTDGLRLFYREHLPVAPSGRLPVICLPGLTRNSRDFAEVAERLSAAGRRVLCADLRGRGLSQHDPDWKNYHPGTYVGDVARLLAHAGEGRAVFLGTSLGGILTMMMAALQPDAVAAAILNDVGPEVAPEGLARIASYVGRHAPPRNWDEAVAIVRATYEVSLPDLSDAQWQAHARRSYSEADGVPRLDMDPMIGEAVRGAPAAAAPDLWPLYGSLRSVPTLAIRGATSDILAPATFERMQREKPDLVRVEIPNRGHVPLLDEPACIEALDAFLARVP